jgi:hypothetical protein
VGERIEELRASVLALIGRGAEQPQDDGAFNALALRLFAYQFETNAPYRKLCERRGRTPAMVAGWQDVPPVPIAAFKELTLACGSVTGAAACFMTSGTTSPQKRGKHYHFTLDVYDASATTFFRATVLPDTAPMRLMILGSPPVLAPGSSLAHYLGLMHGRFGTAESRFFLGEGGLDVKSLAADLHQVERAGEPVCLLGASFAFVHALDWCRSEGLRFRLAAGSRIMDTGGFKGRSREMPQEELYGAFADVFGVPAARCVNMYGMTELSMQCYDSPLWRRHRGLREERLMQAPPWARTLVLDADTLLPAPAGTRGILCHHDLANCSSVIAVLTEDVGVATPDGFRLLGRVQGAESRGCSVSVDELLERRKGTA